MGMEYLSPYIRIARDSVVEPDVSLRNRVIFDYELIYIKEGTVEFTVEDVEYRCVPGDILFLQPQTTHSAIIIGKTPVRQPHVHFDLYHRPDSADVKVSFRPLSGIAPSEHQLFRPYFSIPDIGAPPVLLRLDNSKIFEHKLFALIGEYNSSLPYSELAAQGLFVDLWTWYLREIYLSKNEIQGRTKLDMERVKYYLDTHLSEDVKLDELARYVHLSKYYISHLFRKLYGKSPIKYHQMARINKAKELVQFSALPIGQIAEQMGYLNIGAFSRAFKAVEAVPPSFYR